MSMHAHSLAAYAKEREKLNRRENEVLGALHDGSRMTDRQIMKRLNYNEPNAVRPRITSLVQHFWVVECGSEKDETTGKTVRIVRAAGPGERVRLIRQDALQPQLPLFSAA